MRGYLEYLNVGRPQPLAHGDGHVSSGFRKSPVEGALPLRETGLGGDEQADKKNHGGPEKAVCVYPLEHYPYWEERLGLALEPAAFGENFSVRGLVESDVCVGDVYRAGEALVQVSQPRQPCFKLAVRHGLPKLALWVQEEGRTGFYLRCLEGGEVRAGDGIELVRRPEDAVSVAEANRVMHRDKKDREGIERLLAVSELAASWRRTLEKRRGGAMEDTATRLTGQS